MWVFYTACVISAAICTFSIFLCCSTIQKLLYKRVLEARAAANLENGTNPEVDSLPSYTIVSGLPSYEEALEQLKKAKDVTKTAKRRSSTPPPPQATQYHRLSITELFQLYRQQTSSEPPSTNVKN